ncbi:MAG: DUF2914 domain-containing protein [Chitinivibrionales bacterium]|nr:DUF2914 domain-containing protein [Chitinivibrionales bacterium]
MRISILLTAFVMAFLISFINAQDGTITVDNICFASGIDNRQPVGEGTVFPEGKVFCWIKASTAQPPVEFKYVWYNDNQAVAEVRFEIRFRSSRFWSSKNVTAGKWRVDIVDNNGKTIKTATMTVQ